MIASIRSSRFLICESHPRFISVFCFLLLSCLMANANAADPQSARADYEFDLPVLVRSTPRPGGQADYGAKMSEFRSAFEVNRKRSTTAAGYCNESTFHKRFDLMWTLDRATEEKQTIDMTEFGFHQIGPNAYSIKSPEWIDYSLVLGRWKALPVFESDAVALRARGFRNEDVTLLRNYLSTVSEESVMLHKNRQLMDQMSQTIRERRRHGTDATSDEVAAFEYHRQWDNANAQRAWVCGMFDLLDKQRQRILSSMVDEMAVGDFTFQITTPEDPKERDQKIKDHLASGAYAEDLDRREQKLREGESR